MKATSPSDPAIADASKGIDPLITIITSTYQAAEALPFTIASIRKQAFSNFEWIIVDGGSSDGTVQLIKANLDIVSRYVSEPDKGIYDAWNKGIRLAKGQWFQFLGAGDELANADTLSDIASQLSVAHPPHELVYGDIMLVSERGREPVELLRQPWLELKGRWEFNRPALPMHPEVFHHYSLFSEEQPFDLSFRFCADTELMLRSISRVDPLYVPVLIDVMPIGGVSTKPANLWRIAGEIRVINKRLGLRPPIRHRCVEDLKLASKMIIGLLPASAALLVKDFFRFLMGKPKKWRVK